MKKIFIASAISACVCLLPSCAAEEFGNEAGEGFAEFSLSLHADLTRAQLSDAEVAELANGMKIYISKVGQGLAHHYAGLGSVPTRLPLPTGSYVAEAWAGDSVGASFTQRFYKCYVPFDIEATATTAVDMRCNIANAVVRVDAMDLTTAVVPQFKLTIGHSGGSLDFTRANSCCTGGTDQRGFFMMPLKEKKLSWTLSGVNGGKNFSFTGEIPEVKGAYEYTLKLKYDPASALEGTGGLPVKITVLNRPLRTDEQTVLIKGAPVIRGADDSFDISNLLQIIPEKIEDPVRVEIVNHGALSAAKIKIEGSDLSWTLGVQETDLTALTASQISDLVGRGLTWTSEYIPLTEFTRSFIELSPELLKNLTEGPYSIEITAFDEAGLFRTALLDMRVSSDKVSALDPASLKDGFMDIGATSALLRAEVIDETASGARIEYREKGASEWIPATPVGTRAAEVVMAKASNLKPATTYEFRGVADGFAQTIPTEFTTETPYAIQNASFEDWSTYSASTMLGTRSVIIPWGVGNKSASFWGSGNEGAATAGMTLTNKSEDMVHSGKYSARLESMSAMNMLAAGNVFVGEYVKTDGTNGVLSIGRPYNGSHPAKLRVWANYRPGSGVTVKSGSPAGVIPDGFDGGLDHGQIYVALATDAIEIRTNPSNLKVFNVDDPVVLGYGQVTWTAAFGADGKLEAVDIPIEYFDRAKTKKPTHLVIVVSASKYGDYFSGAKGSVMYLDDFELVYE